MTSAKTVMVLVAGAVIFVGGLLGGFAIQTYLGAYTSTQNPPATLESLTVESYTPKLLTESAVEFTLVNSGTSDIQITDVKLNGYSNQTTSGIRQGWNGTTFLHPNQTGSLYWYAPCYTHVINQTMPQPTANMTQKEVEDLETWMSFYNSTFTFITNTAHQYNCTIQGLGYGLSYAIMEWATRSEQYTFSFMGTEQLRISKITWTWNTDPALRTFVINVNNTGTKDMTISQVLVNYAGVTGTITPTLPHILKATESTSLTVIYAYTNGTNYDISVATASNYKFTNTFSGGQNTG